jgi:hypothetical protein
MTRRSQVVAAASPQSMLHCNHLVATLSAGSVLCLARSAFEIRISEYEAATYNHCLQEFIDTL